MLLGALGHGHPLLAGVLAESVDAGLLGDSGRRVVADVGAGERAGDEDLVTVELDRHRTGEPVVGEAAGEPGGELVVARGSGFRGSASAGTPSTAASAAAFMRWEPHGFSFLRSYDTKWCVVCV